MNFIGTARVTDTFNVHVYIDIKIKYFVNCKIKVAY